MGIAAIVLLIVVGLALVVGVGWLILRAIRTDYPDGEKTTKHWSTTWGEYSFNLIVQDKAVVKRKQEVIQACILALKALVTCHKEQNLSGNKVSGSVEAKKGFFKEISVVFVPDKVMGNYASYVKKMDGVPTIFIADLYVDQIIRRGEPIIHEAGHIILNDYIGDFYGHVDDHVDPTIWIQSGGKKALQFLAREWFKGHQVSPLS